MLGGFGFHLTGGFDIWHQGQVDVNHVGGAGISLELANGFKKGKGFNVPDGAADFNNHHIGILGNQANGPFNLVSNMGDHLNSAAKIFAPALLGDDLVIDLSCGKIVVFAKLGIGEPFIMAQVKIGFRTVIGDKHFTMLEGVHGSRVDIYIRIEFLNGHGQPPAFQKHSDGSRCQSFSQ